MQWNEWIHRQIVGWLWRKDLSVCTTHNWLTCRMSSLEQWWSLIIALRPCGFILAFEGTLQERSQHEPIIFLLLSALQRLLCEKLALGSFYTISEDRLTFRNKMPVVTPIQKRTAATMFGSANGNRFKITFSPNSVGYRLAGEANAPPRMGPKMLPMDHTKGITLNAVGCSSFCGTNSATGIMSVFKASKYAIHVMMKLKRTSSSNNAHSAVASSGKSACDDCPSKVLWKPIQ